MNTWNALPSAYRERVTKTISAALSNYVIDSQPPNTIVPAVGDTSAMSFDADAMAAVLAEPEPEAVAYQLLNIPKAIGEDMFDAEDGIQEEAHECRASFDDWRGTEVEVTEVEEVEVAEGNDAETVDGDESDGSDGSDGRSIT